jgi:LuxR family maltose regulon positive regulatory protein
MAAEDEVPPGGASGDPVLLLTKLRPPAVHGATLRRGDLLGRLDAAAGCRLVLVAGPAGSGKTTLLASWSTERAVTRPMGWVTLDDGDNDPVVLWSHVIESIRRVCPGPVDAVSAAAGGPARLQEVVLPRLVNALTDQGAMTLVLDDFHRLTSESGRDGVAWFLDHAPSTVQLVIGSRTEPRLPLPVLRAHGELFELRSSDLRFTTGEAEVLLNQRLGLGLTAGDVRSLVERTEGWPAGVYLAALSLETVTDRHDFVARFGASNRHVLDFLMDQVLDAYDPPMQTLMTRTSILERLAGPLCDAVTQEPASADRLAELARSNLFLVPLDERGEWYRFHHLFGQLLRVELDRREPGLAPVLHRRASAWHRVGGSPGEAVGHAIEAGDYPDAAELIKGWWVGLANAGCFETVRGWLRRFPEPVLQADAVLLLVAAWVLSMGGERTEAARVIEVIERAQTVPEGPLPDGFSSVESSLTLLRATFPGGRCRCSTDERQARRRARAARVVVVPARVLGGRNGVLLPG